MGKKFFEQFRDEALDNKYILKGASCILLAIMLVIIFVVISILNSNWDWFSRSGSLLVVIGVYLAFLDFNSNLIKFKSTVLRKFFDEHKEKLEMPKSITEDELMEVVDGSIQRIITHAFRFFEFWMIIIGTIIWGYGDLICYAFNQCPKC